MSGKTDREDLVGTWRLLDWKSFKDGEFYKYPMGEGSKGQLVYTSAGRMSGFLMRADFGDEAPGIDTPAAKCLSYAGDFRIEGDEVIHDVDLATIPEWIGSPLVRTIGWDGDRLLLTTGPDMARNGHAYSNALLWERL
ncbi:lipocalin-like domain-containing protein [Sneathiella chinensis]|uniref:Lipocalin-like domain-containing protein n=1 Tax=Sneathiella chinensis TaxID=349750 RepID=A0ABQ5U809_9PROT|nr:lipocalin-like domain-containing protein [Sneathiella chinensis]GLQ07315.1 hypothetical protein GCM10007924_25360 [Sneathiella chinensis]